MTRSIAIDPFSDDAIRAAVEPHYSWRRALPGASDLHNVRAKSIRLGETVTPTQSRKSSLTSTDVVSIETQHDDRPARAQCPHFEQYRPNAIEKNLLADLEKIQPATPAELAPVIRQTISWTTKRLAKLSAKHLVRGKPGVGGGYSVIR